MEYRIIELSSDIMESRWPPMTLVQPTLRDIIAELEILTKKLKCTTDDAERRTLLKEFRALLDGADTLAARYPPTE